VLGTIIDRFWGKVEPVDLIVVGNGIIALTTAFRLAGQARVRVVGPSARPGSATLAAAAMLNSFAELEVGSLDTVVDRFRFELTVRARDAWQGFARELGLSVETGTYALDQPAFDTIVAALRDAGEPHEIVADVPGYRPAAARVERAVWIPREGWIDPRVVLERLERALSGVEWIDASAVRLRERGGEIAGVELDDGRVVDGDHYLIANGASASALLDGVIAMQPVFYGVGVSLEVRAEQRHVIRAPSTYVVPMSGGRTFIGATNWVTDRPQLQPPAGAVDELLRGVALVDRELASAEIVRVHTGWRPTSLDSYPLVGATSLRNLTVATGTRRDGFHLAPVLADYLAAVIREHDADPRMQVFAPERAPIRAWSGVPTELAKI